MIHALALAVAVTEPTSAVALSAGVGVLATRNAPYVGENAAMADGLGSFVSESAELHLVPILSQAFARSYYDGKVRFGVEVSERWWWVWSDSRNGVVPSASHRIDRSVLAIDALATAAVVVRRQLSTIFTGVGPALYWLGTRQRGWFGDERVVDVAFGVRAVIGYRVALSRRVAFVSDVSYETYRVPQRNVVLADGGTAPAVSIAMRLEVSL